MRAPRSSERAAAVGLRRILPETFRPSRAVSWCRATRRWSTGPTASTLSSFGRARGRAGPRRAWASGASCCSTPRRRGSACCLRLTNAQKLASGQPARRRSGLLEDCLACAVDAIIAERAPARTPMPEAFAEVLAGVRPIPRRRVLGVVRRGRAGAVPGARVRGHRHPPAGPATRWPPTWGAAAALVYRASSPTPGWASSRTCTATCGHAAADREAPGSTRPGRAEPAGRRPGGRSEAYADLLDSLAAGRRVDPEVREIRWMVEELRMSLFANRLGTRIRSRRSGAESARLAGPLTCRSTASRVGPLCLTRSQRGEVGLRCEVERGWCRWGRGRGSGCTSERAS